MAVALYDLVRREGKDKYFKFVLIDSNKNDLYRKEIPEEMKERIPLESPRRDAAERDREHFKYLHEKVKFSDSGTIRQRVLARYLIDKKYKEIYTKLRDIVRDFADKHSADLSEEGNSLTFSWWRDGEWKFSNTRSNAQRHKGGCGERVRGRFNINMWSWELANDARRPRSSNRGRPCVLCE